MEVTKKRNRSSEKESLPTDKNNESIYILGDSLVKYVEGWKLKISIEKNHNVYIRSFSGAKIKCMKDYVKPYIHEKNPDNVIFHVGTNELNSELPPEIIAISIIDVAKNTQSDSRIVSISDIVIHNDNFNIKAMKVNKELCKMCEKKKLLFLSYSNINPKAYLNKSKLHLNHNGSEKLGKNFVNFNRNNNAWLPETDKKATIDIGVSSSSSTLNDKSEVDNEIVYHITNADLKYLCVRNLYKIVVGHLNINSIRNKFDFLAHQVYGNSDVLMISETKLDESFSPGQFLLDGYSARFRFARNGNNGGILLYIREDIPSKLLSMNKDIEGFFVEINYVRRKNGY